jgi:hypothetical protein
MVDVALTPEELIQRAEKARMILDDEMVQDAISGIRANIIENWQKIPLTDDKTLAKFHMLYGVVNTFEQALKTHIETGTIENFNLKEKKVFGLF